MIASTDLLSFNYYTYGRPFTGSDKGMRYRLSREPAAEDSGETYEFEAAVWPEPYAESFTDPDFIIRKRFVFSAEGKDEAAAWMNEMHAEICTKNQFI